MSERVHHAPAELTLPAYAQFLKPDRFAVVVAGSCRDKRSESDELVDVPGATELLLPHWFRGCVPYAKKAHRTLRRHGDFSLFCRWTCSI